VSGSSIVELRRYALCAGGRETLIELFERELVETQEACGLRVLGTFRDVDDPDSFVWLRGFADMATRGEGLRAFYGGPVWAEHGDAANATMIDSDNVLLLRPLDDASRLDLDAAARPAVGTPTAGRGVASLTVCPLDPTYTDAFLQFFGEAIGPALREAGASVRARFVTEHSENNFPALPVREGEEFFVWLSLFPDERARDEHSERSGLDALLADHLTGELEVHRLEPTARSLLPD
jgi:NIPSNAP